MFAWGVPWPWFCHYDYFQTSRADHVSNRSPLGACCCAAPPIGARSSTRIKSSHCGPEHFRQKQIEASGFMQRARNGRMTLISFPSPGPMRPHSDRRRKSRSADARLQEPMKGGPRRHYAPFRRARWNHLLRVTCSGQGLAWSPSGFRRAKPLHTASGGKRERGP
jgi:hypothetical protein